MLFISLTYSLVSSFLPNNLVYFLVSIYWALNKLGTAYKRPDIPLKLAKKKQNKSVLSEEMDKMAWGEWADLEGLWQSLEEPPKFKSQREEEESTENNRNCPKR